MNAFGQNAVESVAALGDDATWQSYSTVGSEKENFEGQVRIEDIVEPPSDYQYAAFGKEDPFVPPLPEANANSTLSLGGFEIPIVSPLQKYELKKLNMVGIWQGTNNERKALVMTPAVDGAEQGIIVKISDPVGNKGGKVIDIGNDYITVREFTLAKDGTRQFEDKQMHLVSQYMRGNQGVLRFSPGKEGAEVVDEQLVPQATEEELGLGDSRERAEINKINAQPPNGAEPTQKTQNKLNADEKKLHNEDINKVIDNLHHLQNNVE